MNEDLKSRIAIPGQAPTVTPRNPIAGALSPEERKAIAERDAEERITAIVDTALTEVTPDTPWRDRYKVARRVIAAAAEEIVPLVDMLMDGASKAVLHAEARKRIVRVLKRIEGIINVIPWAIEPAVWFVLDGKVDAAIVWAYDVWRARGKPKPAAT
jgi:hypothetical protein